MLTKVIKNCYNAGSAEGQLEVNPVFWLATWAGKMDSLTQGDRLIEVKIVVINTGGLPYTGLTVLTPLLFMTVTTGPNNSSNSKC